MPCNCDHLEPTQLEAESVKLMRLLKEVGAYKGRVPFYGKTKLVDRHTRLLCEFCQNNPVKEYSLELQTWWRDHQEADRNRVAKDLQKAREARDRKAALAKLTPYERKLLDI